VQITILTAGSRGDVQPFVALGAGLQAAGHRVRLASHATFEPLIRRYGLDFGLIQGNPQALIDAEAGQAWLESGHNPLQFALRLKRLADPLMHQMMADCWAVCQGTEAILYAPTMFPTQSVAERLGVPSAILSLQPLLRTRTAPSVMMPALSLGPLYNLATHAAFEHGFWQMYRGMMNRWRATTLGLPPLPWTGPGRLWRTQHIPILFGYSPRVLPKPPDWPARAYITGYWVLPPDPTSQPPSPAGEGETSADLRRFLAAGPPPVYVGFGSMKGRDPARVTTTVLAALRQAGLRAVLMTGWGGLHDAELPDSVFCVESVPHEWLFAQMAAVVHHGGAGTTGAGLRSGVPSVVCPFFADQPFWGRRVAALGVGPAPIPQSALTADGLAAALRQATHDPAMRARAATLGTALRAEDGVGRAVAVLERRVLARGKREA
jgi:UDP:flavonoid glycosyltransferase YjiC (YdhE family)